MINSLYWKYDADFDFWVFGERNNGCGVGTDDNGKSYYGVEGIK